jgi:endonuclease/exonuclease/phosphatase family metal-dependent hydrolase
MQTMAQMPFRMMEYNVENLFDTQDDEASQDEDFLPQGKCQWDTLRYRKKLADLSKVIMAAGGASPVDLVALCEVENDSVIQALTQRTRLHRLGYEYVMTRSNDVRGIDVALLYQPMRFGLLKWREMSVPYDPEKERPTRNILHATGRLQNGDTLDVFVVHFPSRRGGVRATEKYRCRAAEMLKSAADSIVSQRVTPLVVITGDFNDEPQDKSLSEVLCAQSSRDFSLEKAKELSSVATGKTPEYTILTDCLTACENKVRGTYKYQGYWNRLDHFLINSSMLSPDYSLYAALDACQIFTLPFLLTNDPKEWGGVQPRRMYLGNFYKGGVSDHLPLVLTLWMQE